jgi:formylglycine-generating enzyme required for sulfatase activity
MFVSGDSVDSLEHFANIAGQECIYDPPGSRAPWRDEYRAIAPVGRFQPNRFGLFDITGNVWEWCGDWYADSLSNVREVDPAGPGTGELRSVRGGSFVDGPVAQRVSRRGGLAPRTAHDNLGFRVVRELTRDE